MHWQLANLSIHDASIFPTRIGTNPQLSVPATVNQLAQGLAKALNTEMWRWLERPLYTA